MPSVSISSLVRLVALVFLVVPGADARAAIVALNDPSLGASADGFNITRDTLLGLEWLDLDLSLGRTFDDLIGNDGTNEFVAGGDFAGFRYADRLEVLGTGAIQDIDGLLENFGLDASVFSAAAYGPARQFLSYLGCLGSCVDYGYIEGIWVDENNPLDPGWAKVEALPSQGLNFGSVSFSPYNPLISQPVNGSSSLSGHFLVRAVPEPGTALLVGVGLLALGARRSVRSSAPLS